MLFLMNRNKYVKNAKAISSNENACLWKNNPIYHNFKSKKLIFLQIKLKTKTIVD